jgi:hypothetical protein
MDAIAQRLSPFTRLMLTPTVILGLTLGLRAEEFFRVQILTVPTVTLTAEQFLTGDKNGKPTILAGELRLPGRGTEKLPAVILVPGLGGVSSSHDRWARELGSIGVAAFCLERELGGILAKPYLTHPRTRHNL